MKMFYELKNSTQYYEWGSLDGICDFTGTINETGLPMAELWMGAHPAFPSVITEETGDKTSSLDRAIARNPEKLLGKRITNIFGPRLPFLFKILSAASPLSLQVHPSKKQAEDGFIRENLKSIPINSPTRNYKDENHKPEILCAVSHFTALCGFRKTEETIHFFTLINCNILNEAKESLQKTGEYSHFLKILLSLSPDEKSKAIQRVLLFTSEKLSKVDLIHNRVFELVEHLASLYPMDIGILAPFYLNILDLEPGEAVYLPDGVLHAYIKGTGLELMASSDNVLRAGLTHKHIDINELLSCMNHTTFVPKIISSGTETGIHRYKTASIEFELSSLNLDNSSISYNVIFPLIMICKNGSIHIKNESNESCTLTKGTSVFIAATGETITVSGSGLCYAASIPENG